MAVTSKTFRVTGPAGLDARTAAKISHVVSNSEADFSLEYDDNQINLKKALELLTLGITRSDMVTLFAPLIKEGLLTPVEDD